MSFIYCSEEGLEDWCPFLFELDCTYKVMDDKTKIEVFHYHLPKTYFKKINDPETH